MKAVDNPGVLHIATHGFFIEAERDEFRRSLRNVAAISPSVIYSQLENYDLAILYLRKIIEPAPQFAPAYGNIG